MPEKAAVVVISAGGSGMDGKVVVNIGEQRFDRLMEGNKFYIDKTGFIREWWENGSTVTLITRPRRFGKTLNMSMVECFFPTVPHFLPYRPQEKNKP